MMRHPSATGRVRIGPLRAPIRLKLIVGVLLAALVPLAIVAVTSYRSQEDVALESAFVRLEGIASAQVGQLNGMVEADREIAAILTTHSAVRDGLTGAVAHADVFAALESASDEIERLQTITVVDPDGAIVATTAANPLERLDLVPAVVRDDMSFEGQVLIGGSGEPVAMSCAPVIVDGQVVGAVVIETDITPIIELATNYEGLSQTGETSVAQLTAEGDAEFIAPLRFKEGAALNITVPASAARAPITLALAGEVSRFDRVPDYRAQEVLAVTRQVEGTGWGVVVKIDRAEALEGMSTFRGSLLTATAAAALLVVLVALMVARWISRPVRQLTAAAVAVVGGDLEARADVASRDELGVLAAAVAAMTDSLVDSAGTEAARTRELETLNGQLSESEARVRAIVDHAAEGIVTCDRDGLIRDVNQAAELIFGRSSEAIVGRPVSAVLGLGVAASSDAHGSGVHGFEMAWQRGEDSVDMLAWRPSAEPAPVRVSVSRVEVADEVSYTAVIHDVSERLAFEHRLWELANYDGLTGLPNRDLFTVALEEALADRTSSPASITVLFIDLDRFKVVNDAWGHAAGDRLLELVATRLEAIVRADDVLARFGGDEFVVLSRGAHGPEEMVAIGERVLESLEEPFRLGDDVTYVTASIGIASSGSADVSADDLLSQADLAMYRAKSSGRNGIAVFDGPMRSSVQARHELHTELRRAIDQKTLDVHYQPVVDLQTGEFSAVEALVRWDHPTMGRMAPADFVPVAEESGLVLAMGRLVLERVATQMAAWQAEHPESRLQTAVNLSAREVMHPDCVDRVLRTLETAGASAGLLTVEVTESVLVTDAQTAIENLSRLRDAGVKVALDDFGTGYSSLTYLRDMPVDIVKIDRRFVTELDQGDSESSIAAMVLGLGQTMGLDVIAEGIETHQQHDALIRLGGEHAQGFLYAVPQPAAQAASLLWPADRTVDVGALEF